jgi:hypothetical protein
MPNEFFKNTAAGQVISGDKKIVFNAGYEANLEYAEPKSTISPKIQLLFSPFGLPFVPIEIIGTNVNKILSNLQWTKDRTNPGGILQFTITPDSRIIQDIVDIINKFSFNLYSKIWGELGVDLEDLFKPMTLCQLWIDGYHIMTGYVRSCSRSASVSNEEKEINYNIIVEELGNLYNLSTTSLDLILLDGLQKQIADSMKKALSLSSSLIGVTVSEGIKAILNAFLATTLTENMSMSDGFPLAYRLLATPNPYGGLANFPLATYLTLDTSMYELSSAGGSQSVWSFIQSFIPNPWMELFTESGGRTMVTDGLGVPSVLFPGFNYAVTRTTPYSNPLLGTVNPAYLSTTLLFDLTAIQMLIGGDFIIITDDMIQEKTLGFDSVNQSTVFRTSYANKSGVSPVNTRDRGIKSVGPLNPFASGGIPTFGNREMFQTIDCTSLIGLGTSGSYVERIATNIAGIPGLELTKNHFSNLLSTWFRNQSRFREGPVTIKGMPYARPGMYCLYLPTLSGKKVENIRDIGIYYIDSLDHSYGLENEDLSFTTTLNLIRGVPLPTTLAQTALLLFDFEILPPESGLADGEYTILKTLRKASSII